ncbi:hypothetical protein EDM53_02085 [Rickettsiales endosymbiont of Peranema trichophorum]|uniref:OTU domain-containing protein n=1 Tax=Rickettsiales endosymbiont of Peranema trichophorum TaxID=2486577 RepID=UPI00102389B9|nr:hypothetical protein [Rickettsiales endosymbiont of Peranema trichophorum]RZI47408.1 hypothetical protein EDM53_02085 [Rickettsiales endosymbiont of Peranema trichophorum]
MRKFQKETNKNEGSSNEFGQQDSLAPEMGPDEGGNFEQDATPADSHQRETEEAYASDSSEYSLLSHDCSSGDEVILGPSFNVPHNGQYIPGNRIHKQLAWYQNNYREKFYEAHNGEPRFGSKPFPEHYKSIKDEITKKQNVARAAKEATRQSGHKEEFNEIDKLNKCIGTPYILTIATKPGETQTVYPNFGLAKLGYVRGDKMRSKFLVVRTKDNNDRSHSESQIFRKAAEEISKSHSDAELFVLDLHTTISMCRENPNDQPCTHKSVEFIKKVNECGKQVLVRVSYNFHCDRTSAAQDDTFPNDQAFDYEKAYQQQIEIPHLPAISKSFKVESVVISGGYAASKTQAAAVAEVDKNEKLLLVLQKALQKTSMINSHQNIEEMTIPEGFADVDRDGWCFYHAIAQQISGDNLYTAQGLHDLAINEILSNCEYYQDYVRGLDCNGLHFNDLHGYLNHHIQHGSWADALIINAMANALSMNITVQMFYMNGSAQIDPQGSPIVIQFAPNSIQAVEALTIGNIADSHFVSSQQGSVQVEQHEILQSSYNQQQEEKKYTPKQAAFSDGCKPGEAKRDDDTDDHEGPPSPRAVVTPNAYTSTIRLPQSSHTPGYTKDAGQEAYYSSQRNSPSDIPYDEYIDRTKIMDGEDLLYTPALYMQYQSLEACLS